MIYDAIILGSGAGGMAAGLTLARAGHSVLVLEAGKQYGGMMNPFARGKFDFDVGLHYLGECGPGQALRRVFDYLGLDELTFRELSPEGFDRYVFPGASGALCKGIDEWVASLRTSYPQESRGLERFANLLKAADAASRAAARGPRPGDVRTLGRESVWLAKSLHVTMQQIADHYFRDPGLKNLVTAPCGDVGVPPGRMTGFVGLALLVHFLNGAYYPRGGTRAWRDAFVTGMQKAGAELHRNREVTAIVKEADGTFRVRTGHGDEWRGRTVVSNFDPGDTLAMLAGAKPDWFSRRKIGKLKPSLGTVCIFLGLNLDLPKLGLTDANIWHYPSDDLEGLFNDVSTGALQEAPFVFVTSPTIKDPDHHKAPPGHHTLELITGASAHRFKPWFHEKTQKRGAEYDRLKNDFADGILELVEKHYVPGLRDHVVVREAAPPPTNVSSGRAHDGGIYGPEFSREQTFLGRYLPWVGVPGLYLAGAGVFGPGVMTCTLSGFAAGKLASLRLRGERALTRDGALQELQNLLPV
jgi:phytoene dehydrogenase-like protein